MAPPKVWPENAAWPENAGKREQCSGDARPAGTSEDAAPPADSGEGAGQDGRGGRRFLYPIAVIAGVLFLIILAAV